MVGIGVRTVQTFPYRSDLHTRYWEMATVRVRVKVRLGKIIIYPLCSESQFKVCVNVLVGVGVRIV